jgi:AbrB family looped-hinge helix DNA binding protein
MKEQLTVMTRKGQITVPTEIRQAMGLKIGDKIAISLDETDPLQARLRPVHSVAYMTFDCINPRRRPENMEELRELAMEAMAENALQ